MNPTSKPDPLVRRLGQVSALVCLVPTGLALWMASGPEFTVGSRTRGVLRTVRRDEAPLEYWLVIGFVALLAAGCWALRRKLLVEFAKVRAREQDEERTKD